jgi:hypothetical protein
MTDRHPNFGCCVFLRNKKPVAAVSKGAILSFAAVPFFKGTSTSSLSLKVINEFAF